MRQSYPLLGKNVVYGPLRICWFQQAWHWGFCFCFGLAPKLRKTSCNLRALGSLRGKPNLDGKAHLGFCKGLFLSQTRGFWMISGEQGRMELTLYFSSLIFIREWEWNSKHSSSQWVCVTVLGAAGSVFFQWETWIPLCPAPLYSFLSFLLVVAYYFKNQLTVQVLSGSRFQNKSDLDGQHVSLFWVRVHKFIAALFLLIC